MRISTQNHPILIYISRFVRIYAMNGILYIKYRQNIRHSLCILFIFSYLRNFDALRCKTI